jgi:hypothetical protein
MLLVLTLEVITDVNTGWAGLEGKGGALKATTAKFGSVSRWLDVVGYGEDVCRRYLKKG